MNMAGGWQGQQGGNSNCGTGYGNNYYYGSAYENGYGSGNAYSSNNGYSSDFGVPNHGYRNAYNGYGNGMMQMQLASTPRVPSYGSTVSLPEVERGTLGNPIGLNGGYGYGGLGGSNVGSTNHDFGGNLGGNDGPRSNNNHGGSSHENLCCEISGLGPSTYGRPSFGDNNHGSTGYGGSNTLSSNHNLTLPSLVTNTHGNISLGVNGHGYASLTSHTVSHNTAGRTTNSFRNSDPFLGGSIYPGSSYGMHTRSYTGGESGMVEELPRVVEEEDFEEEWRELPTLPPIKSWFRG